MPEPKFFKNIGLKIIACCAAAAVLCLGLCQVGFYLERNIHDGAPGTLDTIGGIGFVLSIIGLFVGIVAAIAEAANSASKGDRP
ncbi:DUF2975 domain-containing protein [Granulicella aggregans]|uniref:DUF2975 domain-containing protein n=1 Tax=Granulicella aggregans TaxID=474949 RepID=UPI0021DF8B22|nr:hypothetical protein [Granulicella aggregans]